MEGKISFLFVILFSLQSVVTYSYNNVLNQELPEKDINQNAYVNSLNRNAGADTLKVEGIDLGKIRKNCLNFIYFLSDENQLLTNYVSRYAKGEYLCTWDIKDGKRNTFTYLGTDVWILNMALSHNESYLVVSSFKEYSRQLRLYSIKGEKIIWEIKNLGEIASIAFTQDDKEIIAVGNDAVYRIDSRNGKILKEIEKIRDIYPQHNHISTWSFLSENGRYLVIWQVQPVWAIIDLFRRSANKKISVWDIEKEEIIESIDIPVGGVQTAVFSKDNRTVFLGAEKEILLWDLDKHSINKKLPGKAVYMITTKNSKNLVVAIDGEKFFDIYIWQYPYDTVSTQIIPFARNFSKEGKMPVNFDKTGNYCAVERGGTFYLYETANWKALWGIETGSDIQ
jgi:WD40 repeat protein